MDSLGADQRGRCCKKLQEEEGSPGEGNKGKGGHHWFQLDTGVRQRADGNGILQGTGATDGRAWSQAAAHSHHLHHRHQRGGERQDGQHRGRP